MYGMVNQRVYMFHLVQKLPLLHSKILKFLLLVQNLIKLLSLSLLELMRLIRFSMDRMIQKHIGKLNIFLDQNIMIKLADCYAMNFTL